jgi:hypothetical protein
MHGSRRQESRERREGRDRQQQGGADVSGEQSSEQFFLMQNQRKGCKFKIDLTFLQ